jgi:hypothetical protein
MFCISSSSIKRLQRMVLVRRSRSNSLKIAETRLDQVLERLNVNNQGDQGDLPAVHKLFNK